MNYWQYKLWRIRAQHAIELALSTLTYREREIIKLRKGIGDGYVYSLAEVGRIFNVTRERVRQIEIKGMLKLLHPVRLQRMREVFEELLMQHSEPTQKYTKEEIAEHMPEHETEEVFLRMKRREKHWRYWQETHAREMPYTSSDRMLYYSMAAAEQVRERLHDE